MADFSLKEQNAVSQTCVENKTSHQKGTDEQSNSQKVHSKTYGNP